MTKNHRATLQDWDALCRRCGRCCFEKIDFDGTIYYTDIPCQYLDLATKTCRVYEHRDTLRKGCARLNEKNLGKGILPGDCPYVAHIKDYRAPVLIDDEES